MSEIRQMPLFPADAVSTDDLNRHTPMKYTIGLFQRHLLDEGKSVHTVNAFTADLHLLAEQSSPDSPIGDYTTTKLNTFLHWLEHGRGVPCSRKSYARRVTSLKVYFKWLYNLSVIPYDPAKPVLQRSGPAPLPVVLTPEQVAAALEQARRMKRGQQQDSRPELLLRLLLDTGIKKNETMRLTPENIDRSAAPQPMLFVKYKTRNVFKERKIDLDPEWVALLDAYLEQYQPEETIFDCTARNLEYVLADIGAGARIPAKISFEMLRWTCAVRDYRADVDPEAIREKLGLSPISWNESFRKIQRLAERQAALNA